MCVCVYTSIHAAYETIRSLRTCLPLLQAADRSVCNRAISWNSCVRVRVTRIEHFTVYIMCTTLCACMSHMHSCTDRTRTCYTGKLAALAQSNGECRAAACFRAHITHQPGRADQPVIIIIIMSIRHFRRRNVR